jgi:pyrimidine-nucleoside phosphorylase
MGNALEVAEAVQVLRGDALSPESLRFRTHCVDLGSLTLLAAGKADSEASATAMAEECLTSGRALRKFQVWATAQGARVDITDPGFQMPEAPVIKSYPADRTGWLERLDARAFGQAVVRLGGGRKRKEDSIDLRAGVELHAHVGSRISTGDRLFTVHATDEETADKVAGRILAEVTISPNEISERPLVIDRY